MYRLCVSKSISVAMRVAGYGLHGHDLVIEVCIDSTELRDGMVVDIEWLRSVLGEVLKPLDHSYLNEVLGLESVTIEVLARYVYDKLREKGVDPSIVRVRIDGYAYAEFIPGGGGGKLF